LRNILKSSRSYPAATSNQNEYGFRDLRAYEKGQAIALGCSFTYGHGVAHEDAWPWQLEQKLDCQVYNFGVVGGSLDCMVRLAMSWVPALQPIYVFVAPIFFTRYEFFHNQSWLHWIPGHDENVRMGKFVVSEEYEEVNTAKNYHALDSICKNTHLIIHEDLPPSDTSADDFYHPGPDWHKKVAESFHKKVLDI